MSPLRVDGEFTIYRVEILLALHGDKREWCEIGDHQIAQVPAAIRFINPDTYEQHEPFASYSASGKSWQDTGVFGVYDRTLGVQMLDLISRHNPKYKTRLVRLVVSQKRYTIMEAEQQEAA